MPTRRISLRSRTEPYTTLDPRAIQSMVIDLQDTGNYTNDVTTVGVLSRDIDNIDVTITHAGGRVQTVNKRLVKRIFQDWQTRRQAGDPR